jgi:hypothetical protein
VWFYGRAAGCFGDIEALAGELPMLPRRSYRIGSEQGIVVLAAGVIDRRYRWVVALESSIVVEAGGVPVVLRKIVDRSGVRGFVEGDQVKVERHLILF